MDNGNTVLTTLTNPNFVLRAGDYYEPEHTEDCSEIMNFYKVHRVCARFPVPVRNREYSDTEICSARISVYVKKAM